jgi:hypothetical protein
MNLLLRRDASERRFAPTSAAIAAAIDVPFDDVLELTADDRIVRASFDLPAGELRTITELAARRRTSATQVVRQAVATESYLQRVIDRGGLLLVGVGRRARELRFSQM